MKPYFVPPIVVGSILALVGPIPVAILVAVALYLYCKRFYCHDDDEDYKLLQEIKYQRWKDHQRLRFGNDPIGYTSSNPLSEVNKQ